MASSDLRSGGNLWPVLGIARFSGGAAPIHPGYPGNLGPKSRFCDPSYAFLARSKLPRRAPSAVVGNSKSVYRASTKAGVKSSARECSAGSRNGSIRGERSKGREKLKTNGPTSGLLPLKRADFISCQAEIADAGQAEPAFGGGWRRRASGRADGRERRLAGGGSKAERCRARISAEAGHCGHTLGRHADADSRADEWPTYFIIDSGEFDRPDNDV
ncbi:hypothetical protein KM043_008741 [Ampulex compressa]|nr:hypothetical protein KM043_008741 [Ampulex compressa]